MNWIGNLAVQCVLWEVLIWFIVCCEGVLFSNLALYMVCCEGAHLFLFLTGPPQTLTRPLILIPPSPPFLPLILLNLRHCYPARCMTSCRRLGSRSGGKSAFCTQSRGESSEHLPPLQPSTLYVALAMLTLLAHLRFGENKIITSACRKQFR